MIEKSHQSSFDFFLAFLCACLKGLKLYQERSNFPFVARVLILLNINV